MVISQFATLKNQRVYLGQPCLDTFVFETVAINGNMY